MNEYNHKEIEAKWQKKWDEEGINKTSEDTKKPKSYVLDMFPYPSGDGLHVGHPKGYIATDIYSRFKKMSGFNILHPMGWDAFGLPAEQFALKNKIHPSESVLKNTTRFKEQLAKIGFNYDWEREINTTDPKYYKWTQWAFLKMFEKGLAYESNEPINWCPTCKTGLANEDLEGNRCERCDTVVEKKPIRQWVLKITDYAERLLGDIDSLNWPESIKESQKNWIGKSEGSEIEFEIKDTDKKIKVFTTRADTLFGATYCVLAPEHKLLDELKDRISNLKEVEKYKEDAKQKTEIERTAEGKEKTGVELKGVKAINPANNEELPIFIADYVLAHYGTGAIMAVPAHDERDFEFATKFKLPITQVIVPLRIDKENPHQEGFPVVERKMVQAIIKDKDTGKILILNWKEQPWSTFVIGGAEEGEDLNDAILREVKEETGFENLKLLYTSPMVYSEYHAPHKKQNRTAQMTGFFFETTNESKQEKLSEEEAKKHELIWVDLKKETPKNFKVGEWDIWKKVMEGNGNCSITEYGKLTNSGDFDGMNSEEAKKKITKLVKGELKTTYKLRDWVFSRQRYWGEPIPLIHCEKCGVVPVSEKDLPVELPNVKSYEPTGTGESPLASIDEWVNVKCPKCDGDAKRETNTMPQWAGSSWYYLRYIDPKNNDALVDNKKEKYWSPVDMYVGGAEHATRHLIYARFWHKFLYDIKVVNYEEPFTRLQHVGLINAEDGRKMSKRWGNVINPDDIVDTYGADTLRVYEMFMGPFSQAVAWSTESIIGPRRFLERVWSLSGKLSESDENTPRLLHKTIKKVSEDIENFGFNTAIAQMMIFLNETKSISKEGFEAFLKVLAPFAPHITEELWHELGHETSIHLESWPKYDETLIKDEKVKFAIQVNGKLRDVLEADAEASEDEIKKLALESESIKKWIEGKEIKKVIFVKGRLLNIIA